MRGQFRCCLNFSRFPVFKKNYPFYPLFILRIILFSSWFVKICLKLKHNLNVIKDRKRIKPFESWENCCRISKSDLVLQKQKNQHIKIEPDRSQQRLQCRTIFANFSIKIVSIDRKRLIRPETKSLKSRTNQNLEVLEKLDRIIDGKSEFTR